MGSIYNSNGKPMTPGAAPLGDDNAHYQSIASPIEALPQAAARGKNKEVTDAADNPRVHEIVEDEVSHPAAVSIGK